MATQAASGSSTPRSAAVRSTTCSSRGSSVVRVAATTASVTAVTSDRAISGTSRYAMVASVLVCVGMSGSGAVAPLWLQT